MGKSPAKSQEVKQATPRTQAKFSKQTCVLRLYVAGSTARSAQAIANVRRICEEHLRGAYKLEIVDLYQQPQLAKGEQIIALPTLVKRLPLPLRQVIGDMSKSERVLVGLDLLEEK